MRSALPVLLLALVVGALVYLDTSCTPPERQEPERSSHGFRVWSGATLVSFTHNGRRVCVADGWEALGYTRNGAGWATFENGKTGVLIRSDAFATEELAFEESAYAVTLYYPKDLEDLQAYEEIVRNAFERVGALYGDNRSPRPHTVLVTASIPFSDEEADSVYPDPRKDLSVLFLKPDHSRSEQLFFHAVAHLYNRYDPPEYGIHEEERLSASDWSEYEASWVELSLTASDIFRKERLDYLLGVHQAVFARDYSRITVPPFDNREAFDALQRRGTTDWQSSYLDYQYAHYVLAPLILTGIDGLLARHAPEIRVESLLSEIHQDPNKRFFEEVARYVPAEEMERVRAWLAGEEEVPEDLLRLGASRYVRP